MGSVSPVPWLDEATLQRAEEEIIGRMVKGLTAKGMDYRGVLFAGIMVQDGHPFCLEYNVRFGDPETQSLVRRLGPGFADALVATAKGEEIPELEINPLPAVTVVCASQGYPGPIHKGRPIHLGSFSDQTVLFHSGTALEGERLVTAGGRVIGVSAVGPTAQDARAIAYRGVEQVGFDGMQFRKDIGA
jgi:phosphoribosylamine-glycine ligase